jgi:hypothetical protein
MSESKDKTIALNVRLKPSEPSAHPRGDEHERPGALTAADSTHLGRPARCAAAKAGLCLAF